MTRRPDSRWRRISGDTLVLGFAALLVAGLATAISYRAQNGLPWISTYRIHADVPDGAKLLKNADVRIGGARVGQVLAIHAEPGRDGGPPFTRLDLALKPDIGPLPADSTVEVRLASVLGGKFLDLIPGESKDTLPEDAVLALEHAKPAIDIDEALVIFQPKSREAIRAMVTELGNAVAGRGAVLNTTLEAAGRAFPAAERVLKVLTSSDTDLAGFVQGTASAARALDSVAGDLGPLLDDSATTFAALDDDALDAVLVNLPPAESAATDAFDAVGPVLDDAAAIVDELGPAGDVLESSLASVDSAVRVATPVTRRAGALARPIDQALRAVDTFSKNPAATGAISALGGNDLATFGGSAFVGLGAIMRTTATAQLNCNVTSTWMHNLASTASEGDSGGNWLRMVPVFGFSQFNHAAEPAADLHFNPYPHENAKECEAGNEPYTAGQVLGNPAGRQSTLVAVPTQQETGR
ncbi:MAG: MlaD family protein [Solirubrobacteraceae bacterium]